MRSSDPAADLSDIRLLNSWPGGGIVLITSRELTERERREYLRAGVNSAIAGDMPRKDFLRMLQFMGDYAFTHKPVAQNSPEVQIFRMPLWKRAFDIAASLSAILLLSPLLIVVAAAIKLDSPGPVVYKSKRVGSNYRIFDFLKFRSMRTDADRRLKELGELNQYAAQPQEADSGKMVLGEEEMRRLLEDTQNGMLYADDFVIAEETHHHKVETEQENAFVKIENDPRITRLGRFLRKYSIDELPQLFNILRGDMSVVGNRPLPLYEAERLTSDEYIERFMCPSGLTGLWQVEKRGQAGKLSPEQRKQLDIEYARKMSPWFDLKIILRTFTAFIQKENV
jgi:lipopolysaccharide/colanic/teichoic acid biosynthesis glycosyltransferase